VFERVGEHYGDLESLEKDSHMVKHWFTTHPTMDTAPPFRFRVVGKFKDCLTRQLKEAVILGNRPNSLNSKGEFGNCTIPRLTIEADQYEMKVKELEKKKKEEEEERLWKELLERVKEGNPTQVNHDMDQELDSTGTLTVTQFTDIRKVRNMRAPETLYRKVGRGEVRGSEGNLSRKTVRKSRNHALARKQNKNENSVGGIEGTPKRKFESQEGELCFSPAKRINLNMHFETWTQKLKPKPSVEIHEKSDNEGLGPTSHATPKGKPLNL
jgi:hypothetical protein